MDHRSAGKKLSRRKKAFFTILTFLIVWLILDTFAYVTLRSLGETKNIFFSIHPATSDEQISRWYKRTPFNQGWGWDVAEDLKGQFGNRKGREYGFKDRYQIKVFGDSFAFAAGMSDSETFEYLVEKKTGWETLNYGVVGYGTDQALLKYTDNRIKTKYTVLCILDENIERLLTRCRGLLAPRMALKPKPRFIIMPDGFITQLENPIKNASELGKLKDISFLKSLKEHDYWANYYKSLNAPSQLRWPATLTIVKHFDYFLGTAIKHARFIVSPTYESHYARWPYNHLYEEGSEGLKLMTFIVNQFVATAAARDEIPIVLIFPKRETMEIVQNYRKKPYQSLVNFMEAERYNFIDFGNVFIDNDWSEYYIPDGHYSLPGNRIIASKLVQYIQHLIEQQETN